MGIFQSGTKIKCQKCQTLLAGVTYSIRVSSFLQKASNKKVRREKERGEAEKKMTKKDFGLHAWHVHQDEHFVCTTPHAPNKILKPATITINTINYRMSTTPTITPRTVTALPTVSTLLPPRILVQRRGSGDGIECSVHTLPKMLLREFRHVFQDSYLKRPEGVAAAAAAAADHAMNVDGDAGVAGAVGAVAVAAVAGGEDVDMNATTKQLELLAIPTNQKAREDLVGIGDHIEKEKDRLLNVVRLKNIFCSKFRYLHYG